MEDNLARNALRKRLLISNGEKTRKTNVYGLDIRKFPCNNFARNALKK